MKPIENRLSSTPAVAVGASISCALWGSAAPCIKIGYGLFQIPSQDVSAQILFAGLRFFMAGIFTVLIASMVQKRPAVPQKTSWGMVVRLCAFQTVIQYMFYYMGLAHASGVRSSIITGSQVFWAILLACFVFRQEKMTSRKMAGCILGFLGVFLVNWSGGGLTTGMAWNGEGFILLSAISYAVSSVLTKNYSQKENPMVLCGWQFVIGGLIMGTCGFALGGRFGTVSLPGLGMILYLSLVSTVAYSLWAALLKCNPVSKVSVFGFMNPVFGVILSAIFLGEGGEILGFKAICALLLVCLGIFIVNRKPASGRILSSSQA